MLVKKITVECSPVSLLPKPPLHQEEEGIKTFTAFPPCSQPPRNGVPCWGEVRAIQVCSVKATMPNLSTEGTTQEDMVHGLGFLITKNARICRLQAMTEVTLRRPAPAM